MYNIFLYNISLYNMFRTTFPCASLSVQFSPVQHAMYNSSGQVIDLRICDIGHKNEKDYEALLYSIPNITTLLAVMSIKETEERKNVLHLTTTSQTMHDQEARFLTCAAEDTTS